MTHRASEEGSVTRLLQAARGGDSEALNRLLPMVYEELRLMAGSQRRRWHGNLTLNATAIVNEVYLKLIDQRGLSLESRGHFFAVAAKAMRHVLSNYARDRQRLKRGGGAEHLAMDETLAAIDISEEQADELSALDEALQRLERINPRQSRIVECRFFGGLGVADTAAALGLSPATVKRDWAKARAWLYREIREA